MSMVRYSTVIISLLIALVLVLASSLSEVTASGTSLLQGTFKPTAFVYLPYVAKSPTNIPAPITLYLDRQGILEPQQSPGSASTSDSCINYYFFSQCKPIRWTASLTGDMVGNQYGIGGRFIVDTNRGYTIYFRIILAHQEVEQILVEYYIYLPQGTWVITFPPVQGPDPNSVPGDAIIFEVDRSQSTGTTSLDWTYGGPYSPRIIIPDVTISSPAQFINHSIDSNYIGYYALYVTDMDGDLDQDIISAASYPDEVAWWENDGDQIFSKHVIVNNLDLPTKRMAVFAIDLDRDNDMDVLATSTQADTVSWWENDGNANFTKHDLYSKNSYPKSIFAIDLDGDSDVDILVGGSDLFWWQNNGEQIFTKQIIYSGNLTISSVFAIDLDQDSDLDILGATQDCRVLWWENDGNEIFTLHIIRDSPSSPTGLESSVFAADLDNDGDIDILGTSDIYDEIAWWENDGEENFTQHNIASSFWHPGPIYAQDMDGDGDVDLLGGGNKFAWWENVGGQNYIRHLIGNNSASSIFAIDLDEDKDVDVISTFMEIAWWENP